MLILGIETATERVSVAVGGHEGVIGLFEVTKGRRHVETLVPASGDTPVMFSLNAPVILELKRRTLRNSPRMRLRNWMAT